MDSTTLMLSLLTGTVGMGFVMYGKNAGQFVPMGAGVALMICPYFIPNLIILLLVCAGLIVTPFVLRES
ncbi:MAG: hypothetical protein ABSH22_00250 [Tepidisphaeraceae bacterium]|jgi:hypothetical protein